MKKANVTPDTLQTNSHPKQRNIEINANETRMRSSTKRPRAPIACFRCHHKKVRCDGIHPNCTRCLSTGVLCAYPSSRRSRTTQPANVDPFIDNLSQLEARIRQIEADLESQQTMIESIINSSSIPNNQESILSTTSEAKSKLLKIGIEVQESRSILAQMRLKGEQRISKSRRDAAAAAAASITITANNTHPNKRPSNQEEEKSKFTIGHNTGRQQSNTKFNCNISYNESKSFQTSYIQANSTDTKGARTNSSLYFQGMMLGNSAEFLRPYDTTPSNPTMNWSMFDQDESKSSGHHESIALVNTSPHTALVTNSNMQPISPDLYGHSALSFVDSSKDMTSMVINSIISTPSSTRSSSLASSIGFPVAVQPSNSTNSTSSNMTGASSATSYSPLDSSDNILTFNMEDVLFGSSHNGHQDIQALPNNNPIWFYPTS
ncbi:hypothetical protein EDC96DRAFT_339643 [Choanephora cucurbitarum]|nr:hypothetical protein EDC96DRAFT_339643 [Choanephora cucurbitarum]